MSKTNVDVFVEPLEWFIKNGTGLYMRDKNGCLPLHYCFISLERDVFARMTIDPVAVLSILLDAMQTGVGIDTADNEGYTALHYSALFGANICAVTLLQTGACLNSENSDGNTPLALAVLRKHEACALTLVQSKCNVNSKVHLVKRKKKQKNPPESNAWVWIPRRRAPEEAEPPETIPNLIVRNEWQGIVYVLLNILSKNVTTVGSLLRAALQYRKYNLAQTLLGMFRTLLQGESAAQTTSLLEELDLFYVFAANLESDAVSESVSKALNGLFSLGCKWYRKENDGRHRSRVVELLASNGHFQFMKALYDLDQKSPEPFWDSIYYEPNNRPSKNIKFWLKHFAAKFGINSLMLYQRPAFYGMTPCLPRQPVPEFCQETPLIRAIQCSQIALVRFLLQEADLQTDVNKPDEFGITPLMHACMINSDKIVQLLFDPVAFQSQNDGAEQSDTANPENKRKAVTRKFVLKTNLDPCRQSVISERLAFGGGKVKSFMHFMLEPCGWENVNLLEAICRSFPAAKNLIAPSERQRKGNQGSF
ncbi:unnamed protein product [Gongylonema pulchrum]|uniref:Uncharacterized protein n=1 Tax=Gongylonema pulchrum TaxID=637853 RepID=A0A3P7Q8B3_9BILA|nr:unnamed protein product [Gongylonema pulchrum]